MAVDRLLLGAVRGCLLGGAVGGAMGLPRRGLTAAKAVRLFGTDVGPQWLPGRSVLSMHTQQSCLVAMALLESRGEPQAFAKCLVRRFRRWILALPFSAGPGLLAALVMLLWPRMAGWRGFAAPSAEAAPRAALIGVLWGGDRQRLRQLVLASTEITHSHYRAYQGALVIALAASICARGEPVSGHLLLSRLRHVLDGQDSYHFIGLIEDAVDSAAARERVSNLALRLGCRGAIGGHAEQAVPCVIQVWLRFPRDYAAGVREIIAAGGATDTNAAMLGAIIGAGEGVKAIPAAWIGGVLDRPLTLRWINELAVSVARSHGRARLEPIPACRWWQLPAWNLGMLLMTVLHRLRRRFPVW